MAQYDDDDRAGGEWIARAAAYIIYYGIDFLQGAAVFAFTALLIFMDLWLGPQFLFAQADNLLIDLGFWGTAIPWLFSLGTTGLLYALWDVADSLYRKGGLGKLVVLLAGGVAIGDTLLDMGGFVARRGGPEAGADLLPFGAEWPYWFLTLAIGAACLGHEPLLDDLLRRRSHKAQHDIGIGWMQAGLVWLAGNGYNAIKFIAIVTGAFSMFVLDVILTPQIWQAGEDQWIAYAVTGGIAAAQIAMLQRYVERSKDGGFRLRDLEGKQRYVMFSALGFMLVDSWLDMQGYNKSLYGNSTLIISNPSIAWLLNFAIVGVMCTFNELFMSQLFKEVGGPVENVFRRGEGGGFLSRFRRNRDDDSQDDGPAVVDFNTSLPPESSN